jgi:hypothetical protein
MSLEAGLLDAYLRLWTEYLRLSRLVTNVFRTLDRHWVRVEMDVTDRKPRLYTLQILHFRIWREEVLGVAVSSMISGKNERREKEIPSVVTETVSRMQQSTKEMAQKFEERIDEALLQRVLESFGQSGVVLKDGEMSIEDDHIDDIGYQDQYKGPRSMSE